MRARALGHSGNGAPKEEKCCILRGSGQQTDDPCTRAAYHMCASQLRLLRGLRRVARKKEGGGASSSDSRGEEALIPFGITWLVLEADLARMAASVP